MADLNVERTAATCTVFEGNIIVSRGESYQKQINFVETCDYYQNSFTLYG